MLIDATRLPDNTTVSADVCIVGGGPAGITLARALHGQSGRVCVVESGGLEWDRDTDSLAAIPDAEGDLRFPAGTRRRQFGGTATLWNAPIPGNRQGVRMRPLDPIDFAPRPGIEDSGWPFGIEELQPYYEHAQRILGIKPAGLSVDEWPDVPAAWPLDPERVQTTVDQFMRRRTLLNVHGKELLDTEGVQVLLRANATSIELHDDGRGVDHLVVECLGGKRHVVKSSIYVLAAGGIENARLLRLSGDQSRGGIGNEHDLVGRFFMDHVWVSLGSMSLTDPNAFAACALYDILAIDGALVSGRLQLHEQVLREEHLLNGAVAITPRPPGEHIRAVQGLRALRRDGIRSPSRYAVAARDIARSVPYIAALTAELSWRQGRFPPTIASGWSRLRRGGYRLPAFDLELQLELPPKAANRIVITEQRDALGMPMAGVHYRFGELEQRTVLRTRAILAEVIEASGVGRLDDDPMSSTLSSATSIHHHMGVTRMHESPRRGVVDQNGRVHSVANLYVAGSSVFPTGGFANPTLTILALALRLAAHLTSSDAAK